MYRVPRATYRIQFNAGFTFADAREIVPYLAELGISDIYASPILKARKGSSHGYDVVGETSEYSSTSSRITWPHLRRTRGG